MRRRVGWMLVGFVGVLMAIGHRPLAAAIDGAALLREVDRRLNPPAFDAYKRLINVEPDGRTREYLLYSINDGREREVALFLEPASDKGRSTLRLGDNMWMYVPNAGRPIRITSLQSALEGFTVLSADYSLTFGGPLHVMSVTPVLVPVFGDLNQSFGERGHLNVAGKLYVLLFDTDVDVMWLTGGSRSTRFGFDFSRNLRSNLEMHGEWTRVPDGLTPVLEPAGTLVPREQPATNLVMGLRYLTEANTTFIVDYFRNGAG